MIHELKIKDCYFKDVWNGRKTFEIRKNDRDFQVGDFIHFHRCEGEILESEDFDHRYNNYLITYVFNGGEYGLADDYCILAIRQVVKFEQNEDISRVRDLISLLQLNNLDNILLGENEDEEPYDIIDVLTGNGTTKGFSYLQVKLSDLGETDKEIEDEHN